MEQAGMSAGLLRRPLVPAACCFILGILVHPLLPDVPAIYLLLALPCLALALAGRWRTPAVAACFVLAGVLAAHRQAWRYPADHIGRFVTDEPALARVEMELVEAPRILTDRFAPRWQPARQVAQGRVLRIQTTKGWEQASGTILLSIAEPNTQLAAGQRIEALGMLTRPAEATNPGQFDWAKYYRDQRILASLHAPHAANVRIVEQGSAGLLTPLRQKVRAALAAGFDEAHALDHALLRALVLGDSDPQLRDVQDRFVRTGMSHHLAISGMHIAIVGMVVYALCRVLFLHPRTSALVGLAVVLLYGVVVLPSPPVVRSVLLCLAFVVGVVLRKSTDGVNLLALSVLLMLAWKPLDLYNAGFQLSFGTVLGLMLFTTPCLRWLDSWRDPHQVVALGVIRRTRWQRWRGGILRELRTLVVAGGAAWLVSAPLIARHFEQLNPWQIPASIVLAFPVTLALIGGVLKIALSLLLPFAAPALATMAAWPVAMMRGMVDGLDRLPGGDVLLPAPPVWLIVIYYALLAAPMLPRIPQRARRYARAMPALCVPLLFLPLLLRGGAAGDLRLTLLDVGPGQCAIVELPEGQVLLVDAGSLTVSDAGRRILVPFLKQAGIRRIDAIYLSHANRDHFNAVDDLVDRCDVGVVRAPAQFLSAGLADPEVAELLTALQSNGIATEPMAAGDVHAIGSATVEALWPARDFSGDPNDASLVLRVRACGRSILFTGDVLADAQARMLGMGLRADVMVAPHHGSFEESTDRFVEAAKPSILLASNGRRLSGKQHRLDELAVARGIELHRTHDRGAITLVIGRDGRIQVTRFRSEVKQGHPADKDDHQRRDDEDEDH